MSATETLERVHSAASPAPKPSPAAALAKRVAILRSEMQHCLARCEELHDLRDAYLDEFQDLSAQVDELRPSMLAAALRETRELMCRKHPDFDGALPMPRPFGDAA